MGLLRRPSSDRLKELIFRAREKKDPIDHRLNWPPIMEKESLSIDEIKFLKDRGIACEEFWVLLNPETKEIFMSASCSRFTEGQARKWGDEFFSGLFLEKRTVQIRG